MSKVQHDDNGEGRMRRAIVIVLDSVRPDRVGCYGYQRDTSPNIDRLALAGSKFAARVPQDVLPGTNAVAGAMLTGVSTHDCSDNYCPDAVLVNEICSPSLFASNHNLFFSKLGWHRGWNYNALMEETPSLPKECRLLLDWFLATLEEKQPVLSLLWFNETHSTVTAPDESMELFLADDVDEMDVDVYFYNPIMLGKGDGVPNTKRDGAILDSTLHNLDDAITPILKLADDDTLIIVCSDHGDLIGEYGQWFTHGLHLENSADNYEAAVDLLRPVFMVMSQPSPRAEQPATHLDIAPTVAHWLGVEGLEQWSGKTLLNDLPYFSSFPPEPAFLQKEEVNDRLRQLGYIE